MCRHATQILALAAAVPAGPAPPGSRVRPAPGAGPAAAAARCSLSPRPAAALLAGGRCGLLLPGWACELCPCSGSPPLRLLPLEAAAGAGAGGGVGAAAAAAAFPAGGVEGVTRFLASILAGAWLAAAEHSGPGHAALSPAGGTASGGQRSCTWRATRKLGSVRGLHPRPPPRPSSRPHTSRGDGRRRRTSMRRLGRLCGVGTTGGGRARQARAGRWVGMCARRFLLCMPAACVCARQVQAYGCSKLRVLPQ